MAPWLAPLCAALLPWLAGCSLGNIRPDSCSDDRTCANAFGLGSECDAGFCSEPTSCRTGHDCRAKHGGGACIGGTCSAVFPADPFGACTVFEPKDLPKRSLIGDGAPVIAGGMFLFESDFSPPILDAARLAVREINSVGGVASSRPLGMVFCDNGGAKNALSGDARTARIQGIVDYLGGTLGVPFTIGPLTSGDSIFSIQAELAKKLPTVLISPSATSPALTGEPDRLSPKDSGLFWRTAPSDQLQGAVLGQSVVAVYPKVDQTLKKVAVVFRDDAYGAGLADAFQKSWTGQTSLHKFVIGADLAAVAASAAAATPDGVMFVDIGGDRAVQFITAMAKNAALSSKPLYLADGSKNEALLDAALPLAVRTIIFNQTVGTVAAAPAGPDFKLFQSSYKSEFGSDPANSAFTANGYDAVYVGAAGVVFASQDTNAYDGRNVATGLTHLVSGTEIHVSKLTWGAIKSGLTTGAKSINITGVSGALDFDKDTGEAKALIEIWQPSQAVADCSPQKAPCFRSLLTVNP